MMNKAVIYVYVLTIAGDILNDNDFVAVTETEDVALHIAVDKLSRINCNPIIRRYGESCIKQAENNPMIAPSSFDEWLLDNVLYGEGILGISIEPKAIVTTDNFNKIDF